MLVVLHVEYLKRGGGDRGMKGRREMREMKRFNKEVRNKRRKWGYILPLLPELLKDCQTLCRPTPPLGPTGTDREQGC